MSTFPIATAKEVFDLLRDDLAAIEEEFARDSESPVAAVTDISQYLIAGGGKRIRPLLLLLAAKALGFDDPARIRLGAVVEMLHTATLVHDDIIDEADTRRGRPSANTTWGNAKCVLAGDWLYMQSFQTALAERNFRILDLLITLTQQMVEGELLQMEKLGHLINEEEYFDLIYRKTACLFKVSMQLGAVIESPNSLPEEAPYEEALGEYGRNLGLAFQIVDDVLDLLISLTQQMVEGELLQMEKLGHLINEEEYFDLIYRKTACLFKVSMQLGAAISAGNSGNSADTISARPGEPLTPEEQALGEYGRNLGLAFQIIDDMLDLTASDDVLGKPAASDLREGKATLAVIHALERGTGADREAIRTVLSDRSFATVSHAQILEILERHGSLAYAMDTACAYAEAARLSIADLPDTEAKRALLWVPGFVTTRDR